MPWAVWVTSWDVLEAPGDAWGVLGRIFLEKPLPKIDSRGTQDAPKAAQDGPRRPQDAPKMPQGTPKTAPCVTLGGAWGRRGAAWE